MSYTRPQRFVPGRFLRQCDLCGIRYGSDELVRGEDNFWRCRKYCIEVPPLTRDRISAQSQQRREAPPPKWGIPYDQKAAYTEEAELFNFLVTIPIRDSSWPGGIRQGAAPSLLVNYQYGASNGSFATKQSGGWVFPAIYDTCRYLYNLIIENKRPATWISAAKVKLREQADLLLTTQNTSGTPDTNVVFGGFNIGTLQANGIGLYTLVDQAGCAIAVLNAYQILGDSKYLTSARNAANIIRACQWCGFTNTFFTSSDSAGLVRLNTGAHCSQLSFDGVNGYFFDGRFSPTSLLAVEFLTRLKAVDGDGIYGGLGAIGTHTFTTTSAATLSSMITDALNFWKTGVFDNTLGQVVNGFSPSTPKELYNAYPQVKAGIFAFAGTGSWEYNFQGVSGYRLNSATWTIGLRALHFVNGYDAQVASIWTYLTTPPTVSNPLNIGPAGSYPNDFSIATSLKAANPPAPPAGQGNIVRPFYDPKITITATVQARDPVSLVQFANPVDETGSVYFFPLAGDLAAIQSVQDGASFRRMKDIATTARFAVPIDLVDYLTAAQGAGRYPMQQSILIRAATGLSLQLQSVAQVTANTASAARTGNIFRYAPQGFVSSGRPDTTQPGAAPGTLQGQ